MDNDLKRPSAALINREWFEAAGQVLDRDGLAYVCLHAVEYVLYGKDIPGKGSGVGIVFAMIKPALDSDIAKYAERCERNQRNAVAGRQRVAASGTQSQRVAANTTTTATPSTTTTSTTTPSLSPEMAEEREKWLIYGYFWYSGSKAIREECSAFWNYYDSLGWKNNKGAAIVSKIAAARNWRRQFETGQAPHGADAWFGSVKSCPVPDYNVWMCYAGAERTEAGALVRLRCKATFFESLREHIPTLEKSLQTAWKVPAIEFQFIQ